MIVTVVDSSGGPDQGAPNDYLRLAKEAPQRGGLHRRSNYGCVVRHAWVELGRLIANEHLELDSHAVEVKAQFGQLR